jgi:hypothetical protein
MYPTPVIYYTIGGTQRIWLSGEPSRGDQYLEWLLYMTNVPSIPQTISIPYFTNEPDIPVEYATSSVRVDLASPSLVAMMAPALGTARTVREMSGSTPPSPHPVRVTFNLSLRAVHGHRYKSLAGLS